MSLVSQLTKTRNQQKARPVLVVEDTKGKRLINLDKNIYSIGRDSKNSIVIYSKLVSRHHATMLRITDTENSNYLFQILDGDLQGNHSTNGLIINGKPCLSKHLQHQDLIIFGGKAHANYLVVDADLSESEILEYYENDNSFSGSTVSFDPHKTLVPDDLQFEALSEGALIRLASFPELLPSPIIEIDLIGKITYLNPAAIIQFSDLQETELKHPVLLGLLEAVQNERKQFFVREVEVGNAIFEQSVHYIAESRLIRSYLVDISDRKQAEKERELLLAREQEARSEAEAANRMKDEFLATLSHELRTPLNAMLGWTTLLRTRKFDETTTARALETIDRNAKSLAQLIEDVLDVSRIIRGKLRLNLRPVELVSAIEAAIDIVRPAAEAKEIQLESQLDPSVRPVLGDGNRLQQIVWNLLSNAVKFTQPGGRIEIRLSTELELEDTTSATEQPTHPNSSYAQIRISDTGIGIDTKFLPYVFERFRQADSSSTRSHGGLGLGLAIVRTLVELHGGTVKAESAGEGLGSTFIVNIPLIAAAEVVSEPKLVQANASNENPTKIPPPLDGLRVLVVDDQADARELLIAMLQQYGAEVIAVATVVDALEALPRIKPDVLVSDIGMPGEDGYALIRQVREMTAEQGGQIRAIALTGYASASDRTRALSAGFQIHMAKPVDAIELAVAVGQLVGRT
jgi:signal transduction histidine kinase